MRVVIATGIYPPDIGGPATHSADLREELIRRGHKVTIVTLWDGPSPDEMPGFMRFPRRWPWPLRLLALCRWLIRNRNSYEVVYATGLHPEIVAAAHLAHLPVVVKVVGDPAWERARRQGLTSRSFEDFQPQGDRGLRVQAMCLLRNWAVRSATAVTTPSHYLARIVERWLGGPVDVRVIGNGVCSPPSPGRADRREGDILSAMFVGRLISHKRLSTIIEAVAQTPKVALEIIGDGPERSSHQEYARRLGVDDRIRFTGAISHDEVLQRLSTADALILASTYEGLPHVAIEALACGTPVVAPDVGGISEAIRDEVNGLIVRIPTATGFAEALARLRDDPLLGNSLSAQARLGARRWRFDECANLIESLLKETEPKPRTIFLGKGGLPGSIGKDLERKLTILVRRLDTTIVTVSDFGVRHVGATTVVGFPALSPNFLESLLFYTLGPVVALARTVGRRRCAIVCQSPYEGFGTILLSRVIPRSVRPRIAVEIHGDWRTATRLYGNRTRRVLTPLADRAASWAIRHADRVRAISGYTEKLVRAAGFEGDVDRFPTFSDFAMFLRDPVIALPIPPKILFVGALDRHKGIDVLLEAWIRVEEEFPEADLIIAGDGPWRNRLERLVQELWVQGGISLAGQVSRSDIKEYLDDSSLLVLPSRSEGLGRVILEAFARGRPVVATAVGGIPELIEHGHNGLLVPPEDPSALADAIVELLSDRRRIRAMGRRARELVAERDPLRQFEAGIERLASWIRA